MRHRSGATRRMILGGTLGGLASIAMLRPAGATPAGLEAALREFTGEAAMRPGRIKLDLPPLVDNGNLVAASVTVDSPMTPADYVKRIGIFNEKNPQPHVATFHLGPRAGWAHVTTRMRLADSQRVIAVAEMSDGTFWSDSADVIVTLAACLEIS